MTSYFEDLASEENPSELTSYADQSLDIDETFQVGFRYNLVNEKRIVESRHTPDQHVFKVSNWAGHTLRTICAKSRHSTTTARRRSSSRKTGSRPRS